MRSLLERAPVVVLVAVGGGCGSLARVAVADACSGALEPWLATSAINFVGCVLAGFAWARIAHGASERHRVRRLSWSAFVVTGFCGGFTTFSGFGLQTALLAGGGALGAALGSFWLTIVVTLFGASAGVALGRAGSRAGGGDRR
ncbi:MAG: CrcB family protein [Phycisphaerales bacterium]